MYIYFVEYSIFAALRLFCTADERKLYRKKGGYALNIPNDPAILLSYINTKLRDEYPSFDELCRSLDLPAGDIAEKLAKIGYSYNKERNCFA